LINPGVHNFFEAKGRKLEARRAESGERAPHQLLGSLRERWKAKALLRPLLQKRGCSAPMGKRDGEGEGERGKEMGDKRGGRKKA